MRQQRVGELLVVLVLLIGLAACGNNPQLPTVPVASTPGAATTNTNSAAAVDPTDSQAEDDTPATEQSSDTAATSATNAGDFAFPEYADMDVATIDIALGQERYVGACAACHGQDATGIEGIDLDLRRSKFVAGATEQELALLLIRGLSINNPFNVSEIRMPPRGGRDDMSNQDMLNIAAYLKSINTQTVGAERVAAYLEWLKSDEAQEIDTLSEVGKEGLSGAALDGQTTYLQFCAVCHGPNAEGVDTLGKGFRDSTYVAELSDEELIEFLSIGRADDDPLNETGIEMLPFGGQPYLTDKQLNDLVAYIRVVNDGNYVPPRAADHNGITGMGTTPLPQQEEVFALIDSVSPRCFSCHVIGERGNQNGPGPNLNGLKDRAGEQVPGMEAEEYVRSSIIDPGFFLVEECPRGACVDVMSKTYPDKFTDDEITLLVDFLLSLPAD
jgi:disulfide bond formation protein DsbB